MRIERLKIADLGKLEEMAGEFYSSSNYLFGFRMARFVEFWTAVLGNGAGIIFAARERDQIAGVIGGIAHQEIYGDDATAQEFFMFIRKEYRGGWAFVGLYRAFDKWAVLEKGCKTVQMGYLHDSMPARMREFYEARGYHAAETIYQKRLA